VNELYLEPLWISIRTVLAATAITFFLGIAAARWMAHYPGRFRSAIDAVLILPMVLPPTVVGFGLLLLFGNQSPVGRWLISLGANVVFSWPATVIAAVVMAFPLMYMTSRGAFEQVEPNIERAPRRRYWRWHVRWANSAPRSCWLATFRVKPPPSRWLSILLSRPGI